MPPEQLNFFGVWEQVSLEPAPLPVEPPPPPVPVDDPRQASLFDGPQKQRRDMERACEDLDAGALRAAWREVRRLYPDWPPADRWPLWADGITHLVGRPGADLAPREQAARARLLGEAGQAARLFPGMSAHLLSVVSAAALCRAAARLHAAEGPGASLSDGRPAGYLLLLAHRPEDAVSALRAATAATPADGRVHGYLGEALFRAGHVHEAIAAYRDAYLRDAAAVDEAALTCTPVLDLLDLAADLELAEPGAWLPVLADLRGVVLLPPWAATLPAGAGPARTCAAQLVAYREGRSARHGDGPRLALKRAMLRLAPALKEDIRRI